MKIQEKIMRSRTRTAIAGHSLRLNPKIINFVASFKLKSKPFVK